MLALQTVFSFLFLFPVFALLMCVVWSQYVVTLCCVRQPQSFLCVSVRWTYGTSLSYHWAWNFFFFNKIRVKCNNVPRTAPEAAEPQPGGLCSGGAAATPDVFLFSFVMVRCTWHTTYHVTQVPGSVASGTFTSLCRRRHHQLQDSFISQNWNSAPIKHSASPPHHPWPPPSAFCP